MTSEPGFFTSRPIIKWTVMVLKCSILVGYMDQYVRFWTLSPWLAAKPKKRLRDYAVSTEPSLLA